MCYCKIFVEWLGEELKFYVRWIGRLNKYFNVIGFVFGGNVGLRLVIFIGMFVSSLILLRVLLNMDDEYYCMFRVLGVDDWVFWKGNIYGIILVDLESNKLVDFLFDREVGILEKWLKSYFGVEIISWDRVGSYV